MLIAETIIPISLNSTFHYSIPTDMQQQIQVGMRVLVSFGKKQYTTALVYNISNHETTNDEIPPQLKSIISILDTTPSFTPLQLALWKAIASYYQCSLGDIFKNESPSYLKVESETSVSLNESTPLYDIKLSKTESSIIDLISSKPHSLKEISSAIGIKSITRAINSLINKKLILLDENIKHKYKPIFESYVALHPSITSEEHLHNSLNSLSRSKKQTTVLNAFLDHITEPASKINHEFKLRKSELIDISSSSQPIIAELFKKNILQEIKIQTLRKSSLSSKTVSHQLSVLSPAQQHCLDEAINAFRANKRVLLHGVAYSGKTEIYRHLIKDNLSQDKQSLILVPENALASQIAERLHSSFGDVLAIYNNKLSGNEQTELWNNVKDNKVKIIVGTRSAIFLPFANLGLIIVDEEHDQKYKQSEQNPRYHARNAALLLAHISNANAILGSATPSIESYTNALNKKLQLISLNERYNLTSHPQVHLINMLDIYKKNMLRGHFSFPLISKIETLLQENKQIIILQNRRGYASFIECKNCGHTPKCPNCNVSLSVHRKTNALKCHYCNHTVSLSSLCENCSSDNISFKGFGTEQVEAEAANLFPNARIARMDIDSMSKKYSYENIISQFNNHQIDIIIGTSMISKGLDFDNVALAAILNADNMLHFPDFRAHEYAFQLIMQTIGRSGRGLNNAEVYIQTSTPEHPLFNHIVNNNYTQFFAHMMSERQAFKYPPYFRIIKLTIKHTDLQTASLGAEFIAKALRSSFGERVLGPDSPIVERINNQYIKNIIIKIELDANISRAKQIIVDINSQIRQNTSFKKLSIITDVDPI